MKVTINLETIGPASIVHIHNLLSENSDGETNDAAATKIRRFLRRNNAVFERYLKTNRVRAIAQPEPK